MLKRYEYRATTFEKIKRGDIVEPSLRINIAQRIRIIDVCCTRLDSEIASKDISENSPSQKSDPSVVLETPSNHMENNSSFENSPIIAEDNDFNHKVGFYLKNHIIFKEWRYVKHCFKQI